MSNPEREILKTEANGATSLFETTETPEPVQIHAPDTPNPSPLDNRSGKYNTNIRGQNKS